MFSKERSRTYWVRICSAAAAACGRRSAPLVSSAMDRLLRLARSARRSSMPTPGATTRGRPSRAAAGSSPSGPAGRRPRLVDDLVVGVDRSRPAPAPAPGRGRSVAARTVTPRGAPADQRAPHRRDQQQQADRVGEEARRSASSMPGDAGSARRAAIGPTGSPPAVEAARAAAPAPAGPACASAPTPATAASTHERQRRPAAPIAPPTSMKSAISTIGSPQEDQEKPACRRPFRLASGRRSDGLGAPEPLHRCM